MTHGYQLDQSLRLRLIISVFDNNNFLLELGGLPHVLPLAFHLECLGTPSRQSGVLRASIWHSVHGDLGIRLLTGTWPRACQYGSVAWQDSKLNLNSVLSSRHDSSSSTI